MAEEGWLLLANLCLRLANASDTLPQALEVTRASRFPVTWRGVEERLGELFPPSPAVKGGGKGVASHVTLPPDFVDLLVHSGGGLHWTWGLASGGVEVGCLLVLPLDKWREAHDPQGRPMLLFSETHSSHFYLALWGGEGRGSVYRRRRRCDALAGAFLFAPSFAAWFRLLVAHAGVAGWEEGCGVSAGVSHPSWSTRAWLACLGTPLLGHYPPDPAPGGQRASSHSPFLCTLLPGASFSV